MVAVCFFHNTVIPFSIDTMMKFSCSETAVELLYQNMVSTPKTECSKTTQLGVSFAGGYIGGIFCAIVSHPADNIVSFLNSSKGATVGDVSALEHLTSRILGTLNAFVSVNLGAVSNRPLMDSMMYILYMCVFKSIHHPRSMSCCWIEKWAYL